MIVVYAIVALLIAWIWVEYFRLIDVYDKNDLFALIAFFVFGAFSTQLVFLVDLVPDAWRAEQELIIADLTHTFIGISLVEETAKLIAFLIGMVLFKSHLREPVDYLIFMCVTALGFSSFENLLYFRLYGASAIDGRSILASVGHMFDSALIAYGIMLYKFHPKKHGPQIMLIFFIFAVLAHGFYDFILMHEPLRGYNIIFVYIYFLATITLFATILNNGLNNSSYFKTHAFVHPNKVTNRLLFYYLIIVVVEIILLGIEENIYIAVGSTIRIVFFAGGIIIISTVRLSRFRLIQNQWAPLRPSLPFSVISGGASAQSSNQSYRIHIKGDSFIDSKINSYLHQSFEICPVTKKNYVITAPTLVKMEEFEWVYDDVCLRKISLVKDSISNESQSFIIRTKTGSKTLYKDEFPMVALMRSDEESPPLNKDLIPKLKFVEWCYLKDDPNPIPKDPINLIEDGDSPNRDSD